ncbi:MogA/MoaB family molybdenum cofactor biosynthesis protein [Salinibaculum salinum]|uniref:MogA/MoaB family molybdenum cofactor biosynthesis protein n=1 Tax=Salinibaculum salinum TaxID=3131996 RepID=UPI0030EB99CD
MADDDQHHEHHDHETGHDGHHADDRTSVLFGILTVSSSRTLDNDASGDAIVDSVEAADHTVASRDLVADDERAIRDRLTELLGDEAVDAVVTTGGTGLTPDDVTPEAASELFDREIPGFGEQFRAQSVEDVGPHGMLTRATAGIVDGKPVFCLPGSEQAADFGTTELVVPVVGHVVGLAGTEGDNHDDHSEHGGHEHGGHE